MNFRITFLLTTCIVFSTCIFCGCGSAHAQNSRQIRVLTYNIRWGERADIEALSKVIASCKPDFVALQEVSVNVNYLEKCAANNVQAVAQFGFYTKMHTLFGATLRIPDYPLGFGGGEFGNAILSKYSFDSTYKHTYTARGTEPRVALESIATMPDGTKIRFVSTHLDHNNDTVRHCQVEELNAMFNDEIPTIVAGDFNEQPDSKNGCIDLMRKNWTQCCKDDEKTFIAWNPTVKIDYVFARPSNRWRVVESRVIDQTDASDHRPLLVVLETIDSLKNVK